MHRALECPLEENLAELSHFLAERGVVHRISEDRGLQVLWTLDETDVALVRELHARGVPALARPTVTSSAATGAGLAFWIRRAPLTLLLILACLLVALITALGARVETLVWFTITPPLGSDRLLLSMDPQQPWRLFSPMLLHFGVLHLAFNMLWLWELGRRIELRSGSLALLLLVLGCALVSNVAQLQLGGNPWFGGMYGVLYGLLGYCWLYHWLAPHPYLALPKGVVVLMLVWLLLCLSGLVTLVGFGAIANTAHVSGLLYGGAVGLLAGVQARRRAV